MPVKKNRPTSEESIDVLIGRLSTELDADADTSENASAPVFLENYQPFSDRFSVRVVWSGWQGVPRDVRVDAILEAYRRSKRKDELSNLVAAVGVTPIENNMETLLTRGTAGFSSEALQDFARKAGLPNA